jgi:hypothetical protein
VSAGSRRAWVLAGSALFLALLLVRPDASGWLKKRAIQSMTRALGRPVSVSAVHLRLLPHPGFELENFAVQDDPAFGAEPVVRAATVTASVRLLSLLRGHLEIARVSLTEPSLNLVRSADGRWNVGLFLERTAQISVAPTSKPRSENRPGFPYIEAADGRINFKYVAEKKPYALMDADFSLWQESENEWRMRLRAEPMRTDFSLSDTGILRVTGSWRRAATALQTPLQVELAWQQAQLGQATKLIYGEDTGWRGEVDIAATLRGTPGDLGIETETSVQDFRRYDILRSALRLGAHCTGHYSAIANSLSEIDCKAPLKSGSLHLAGDVAGLNAARRYNLVAEMNAVPMQSVAALLGSVKKDLPEDLSTTGMLSGELGFRSPEDGKAGLTGEGHGEATQVRIKSEKTQTDLAIDSIPFGFRQRESVHTQARKGAGMAKRLQAPLERAFFMGPMQLALGRANPTTLEGWLSPTGYEFRLQGEAQIQKLLRLSRTAGLPTLPAAAEGQSKLDLVIAGDWRGVSKALGTAQLHGVRVEAQGVHAPVQIENASLALGSDDTTVQNLSATIAGTEWTGWLKVPRQCQSVAACPVHFNLNVDQLSSEEVYRWFNPSGERPWYRLLSQEEPGGSLLASIQASGQLTADRVQVGRLNSRRVTSRVELAEGKLHLLDLKAEVLGGDHAGEWDIDFRAKPVQYSGAGQLQQAALEQFASLSQEDWLSGTGNLKYEVRFSGARIADFMSSATATFDLDAVNTSFPHIELAGKVLRGERIWGQMVLRDGKLELRQVRMQTDARTFLVSGTATLGRSLNLRLMRDDLHGFALGGTLAAPRVSAITPQETQAELKP